MNSSVDLSRLVDEDLSWQGVFGILCIPAALIILTGILLRESRAHNYVHRRVSIISCLALLVIAFWAFNTILGVLWKERFYNVSTVSIFFDILLHGHPTDNLLKQVDEKFLDAAKLTWMTLRHREVWRPCLYMFTSLALGLNIREGMFYWFTDAEDGPKFSQVCLLFPFRYT